MPVSYSASTDNLPSNPPSTDASVPVLADASIPIEAFSSPVFTPADAVVVLLNDAPPEVPSECASAVCLVSKFR